MTEGVEALRAYYRARYGTELTDAEVKEIVERETGGASPLPSTHYKTVDGFEVLIPTWNAFGRTQEEES